MSDAPADPQPIGDPTSPRSNKTYDELIREYIRAARERLEAAKRTSPPPTAAPVAHLPVRQQQPTTPATEQSLSRTHGPQPSLNWPLPASGLDIRAEEPEHTARQAPDATSDHANAINFTDRPARVLAAIASQLAPRSSSLPKHLSNRQPPAAPVVPSEPSPAMTLVNDGDHTRHSFLERAPAAFEETGPDGDDHNPFADGAEHGDLLREASVGRSHKATLTKIRPRTSQDQDSPRTDVFRDSELSNAGAQEQRVKPRTSFRYSLMPATAGSSSQSRTPSRIIEEFNPPHNALETPAKSTTSGDSNEYEPHAESSPPNEPMALRSAFAARPDTATSTMSSAASFRMGSIPTSPRQSALSERVGTKKPSPLNLEAVKTAEARGSLTSLPDLIQRALKLASNLEKGRTSSRMGTDWLAGGTPLPHSPGNRANSPLPPSPSGNGRASPYPRSAGLQSRLRQSHMPSLDEKNAQNEKGGAGKPQRRKCCGMPLWLFVFILVLIFMLVAAAILVPIFLIVIPRHHQATTSTGCQNGAQTYQTSSGVEQCICVNGYTGSSCTRIDNSGCVTTDTATATNATVGVGIAGVFTNANTTYGIKLNPEVVLGLLSSSDITCAAESNLITFNGLSSRSLPQAWLALQPVPVLNRRQSVSSATAAAVTVVPVAAQHDLKPRRPQPADGATSEGIVFATAAASTATPSASSSSYVTTSASTTTQPASIVTAASSSASPTSTASSGFDSDSEYTLGFARTAVLFVLQSTTQLSNAQLAHSQLVAYLTNPSAGDATNISLGNGWSINLVKGTISDAQGDVYGA